MTTFARIVGGVVVEVCAGDPAELYHASVAELFESVADEVQPGWLRLEGGEFVAPEPAPAPLAPAPAPAPAGLDLVARQLVLVVDDHINSTARGLGYESIVTAVSYATEPAVPRFQSEGIALRAWRSLVYARLYELQAEALAGARPIPTPTELIGLLPEFLAPV
ncbi:MAG: hypothetical protein AB7P37_20695 [Ramlibacter sp.]